jgi:hypothetical protein
MLLCSQFACDELLEASAAEAAWNFCAPVVDYDGLRKEVAAAFVDKAIEIQGMVVRLQKTQRAAEKTLDKRVSHSVVNNAWSSPSCSGRYETKCAPQR